MMRGFAIASLFLLARPSLLVAQEILYPLCNVALHEERLELADFELDADVARSNVAAFGEIFRLIEGLWKADAIDRMSYLRAKYDYDAATLTLEQNDLILARQQALVEQYRLVCDDRAAEEKRREIERANHRYRRADCDQLAKSVEVAQVNLTFNREILASVLDLRKGQVATREDVILAELDVAREETRLTDAKRRTESGRRDLAELKEKQAP